jgi:hypothetical protein
VVVVHGSPRHRQRGEADRRIGSRRGAPLVSTADRKRHHELFRGERGANGKWTFTPFTRNSAWDNLRPVVPSWNDPRTALVWMRGGYKANHGEWYSSVVAAIVPPR